MGVPLFDPATPLAGLRRRLGEAIDEVLDRGQYILGPEVAAFEQELAAFLGDRPRGRGGQRHRGADHRAARAGRGPGDDVVVPSFSFYASAEAIPPTGARPVFCDVDRDTYCATPDTVKAALTPRTKAVIVVDLFGNVAPVREIEALGVPVVEDAAQAVGSTGPDGRAGALGTLATLSFYPSKNLGAFGDGGAVTTADAALAERVRMLRFHGSRDKVSYEQVGYNSRLDELQAAILRVQLPELERWAAHRHGVGEWYAQAGLGELVALQARPRGHAPGVARLRRPPRARRRPGRRPRRGRHRIARLLPHPDPPPAGDGRLRGRGAAGDRRAGPHAPGPAGVRGHAPRPGRRGRRRRARCGSGLT